MALCYWLRKKLYYRATERLTETGTCYEMEMNDGKTKVMRISWQSSPIQIMKDEN
jgi:hypothetical protein